MNTYLKISATWFSILALYGLGFIFFPHKDVTLAQIINLTIQALLIVVCWFLVFKEPNRKKKYVFLNFFVMFLLSVGFYVYNFVGNAIFTGERFASHYYYQYMLMAYILMLSISIVFLVIDLLFVGIRTSSKYLITLAICGTFFGWYFTPYFSNPLYLYSTENIQQWKMLSSNIEYGAEIPPAEELSKNVTLSVYDHNKAIGKLSPAENLRRIEELSPYLEGDNYMTLLNQPLFSNLISMNVMVIGFILLFFGYQYKTDPPQSAYLDKIMFTFLLFVSTEILHYWGFMKSVELASLVELFSVGQYISVFILGIISVLFVLRLRFVMSVQGEYYETQLATNPTGISRWRDAVDSMILAKFFNGRQVFGRLFQSNTSK